MGEFRVVGPLKVKIDNLRAGRVVVPDDFWRDHRQHEGEKGVYVFAVKPPKTDACVPWYVGKASKTFGQEVFTDRNQLKYNRALARYRSGAAVLFLVVHPSGKGKTNRKHIGEIEDHFINQGFTVNRDIENDRGIKRPAWAIGGVVRGTTRKASSSARAFSRMFGLKKE
jgi:hypothetical protein